MLQKVFKPGSLPIQKLSSLSFPLLSTQPNPTQTHHTTQPGPSPFPTHSLPILPDIEHLHQPSSTDISSKSTIETTTRSRTKGRQGGSPPTPSTKRESPVSDTGAWEGASGVLSTTPGVEPDVSPVEQWRGPPILSANRALESKRQAGRKPSDAFDYGQAPVLRLLGALGRSLGVPPSTPLVGKLT